MGTFDQANWHGLVATARSLPLDRVATALGYRRDVRDKARWKRPGSVLSINGEKFFDHMSGTGGGGAISLVMHSRGGGFRDAVAFLSAQGLRFCSPNRRDGAAAPAGRRRLDLPTRSQASWPEVCDHLVTERGIGGMLLQVCHARGLVYADRRRNAVFVSRDVSGKPTGAEIVGLRAPRRRCRVQGHGAGIESCCSEAITHLPETAASALRDRSFHAFRLSGEVAIAVQSTVVPALWKSQRVPSHVLAKEKGRRDGARDRQRLLLPKIRSLDTGVRQRRMLRKFQTSRCQKCLFLPPQHGSERNMSDTSRHQAKAPAKPMTFYLLRPFRSRIPSSRSSNPSRCTFPPTRETRPPVPSALP